MMKITKAGRERPILYQGKFQMPTEIVSRLSVAKNHLMLAKIANFNAKIDQYYLAIDNSLSALIVAKEGTLTTKNHEKKIQKFFKYLRRRVKVRSIDKEDFLEFYRLWLKSRYRLYFPSSLTVEKMRLFASHLYGFMITELARFFKSDENILAKKIDELLDVYQSEVLLEEVENLLQMRQVEAEEFGEMYGGKLAMKFLNPWNFMEVSLLTDSEEVCSILDRVKRIRRILVKILMAWDQLVSEAQMLNFEQIASRITNAKMKKGKADREKALKEAIEAAAKHPETHNFRLVLNLSIDSRELKKLRFKLSQMKLAAQDLIKNPSKAIKDGWEIHKEYS